MPVSATVKRIELYDSLASSRDTWIQRNQYFYDEDIKYLKYLIPEHSRVIEIGCGTGYTLNALNPLVGLGVDISTQMIDVARERYPNLHFEVGNVEDPNFLSQLDGPYEYVVLSDTIGILNDCQQVLNAIQEICDENTRLVVSFYGFHWEPLLRLATLIGHKMPQPEQNFLTIADISNFLHLAEFEEINREWRQLVPKRLLGIGVLINRYVATLPLLRKLCLRNYLVARSIKSLPRKDLTTSIVIPCRNEKGNIEQAVTRLPVFGESQEIVFVEGHSNDGTFEECIRVQESFPQKNIQVHRQIGVGKGDAVRLGFECATGDLLFILDADLTVPPEDLPKFYNAVIQGKGEYINGSRLVYPLESGAMRLLNLIANWLFAKTFSYLLNQRITDTLCGTKVLRRRHYEKLVTNRNYFGSIDPFGDFDLLFGSAKLSLKFVEVPIRYRAREYGETQISRFRHGLLLARMVIKSFFKMKAI